ncbi:DHHC family palmitoyltransferase [Skeletonema marinoi]|uniref:Palmitoyltransferase n=1 Tax=Skeletonema marinoi TaxID=267567 RepID=A0AAD8YCE9_9STRA|nr:DHHC family palmitoyltransferase [Skeletonema marinoi]
MMSNGYAASAIDRGTLTTDIRNEYDSAEDDSTAANDFPDGTNPQKITTVQAPPDSPKSFNSEDIFDDVEDEEEMPSHDDGRITDQDLDRLLGPLPSRRTANNNASTNNHHTSSLEVDNCSTDDWSREKKNKKPSSPICPCCPNTIRRGPGPLFAPTTKVGNVFILSPRCYNQFGFGVIGPHWFGPVCCAGLETIATIYYYPIAKNNVGMISAVICLLFYCLGLVSLCLVACSDPGIVKASGAGGLDGVGVERNGYAGVSTAENNITARAGWRYCDLCSVYQPPSAMHCPECNVCIEGYDHHCPWMGQCIGKKNFTSFMMFNCSWLFYLLYAIIWVTFLGQAGKKYQHHGK